MKLTSLSRLPWIAALALGIRVAAIADDHGVHIHHAVEVEFETERGRVHRLQGSDDLKNWTDVDDRKVGYGSASSTLLSIQGETNKTFAFFRVVTEDVPADGPAPTAFTGLTLQLDDRDGHDQLKFNTETNGVKVGTSSDPFNYQFARTGTNEVQVEITNPGYYQTVRRDVITFTFTTPTMGNWVRDEYRKGRLKDRDVGVFSLVTESTDPAGGTGGTGGGTTDTNTVPVLVPTNMPTAIKGLAFTFGSGSHPDRLEFSGATDGTVFDDDTSADDSHAFTYLYTVTETNKASIVVTFKPGRWHEYTLNYNTGAQGSFVRREFKDGKLDDTDSGVFSAAVLSTPSTTGGSTGGNCYYCGGGDDNGGGGGGGGNSGGNGGGNSGGGNGGGDDSGGDDHGGNNGGGGTDDNGGNTGGGGTTTPPVDGVTAPAAVVGISLSLDDDSNPADVYLFSNATAGTKTEGTDVDSFTYTYAVTGTNTAHAVVQFKVGRWSEIDLTFTAAGKGTFVRKDFDKGAFKATKSGAFHQL